MKKVLPNDDIINLFGVTETDANYKRRVMGRLPLPLGDFFFVNLELYKSVLYTNYVKIKIKNKLIIDTFFLLTY